MGLAIDGLVTFTRLTPGSEAEHANVRESSRFFAATSTTPKTFVRPWALDGLATFAQSAPALRELVTRQLDTFVRSGAEALAARARHIRARLSHWAA